MGKRTVRDPGECVLELEIPELIVGSKRYGRTEFAHELNIRDTAVVVGKVLL